VSGDAPRSPVEKFLGAAATAGGPFALLALAPEDCTQELIIVQLQRQLKRVASHADAATHSADEVRLALHAAAAQLLEGISRAAAHQHVTTDPTDDAEDSEPSHSRSTLGTMSPGLLAMEGDIIATMAMCGGWNAQCMHRLALIAHSRGVSQEDFLAAIDAFVKRPAPSAAGGTSQLVDMEREARPSRVITDARHDAPTEEHDPTKRVIATGLIVMVVGLALLGGLIYIVATFTTAHSSKPALATSDKPASTAEDTSPVREKPTELFPTDADSKQSSENPSNGPAPASYKDPNALLRDLRALAEGTKAASNANFVDIIAAARDLWPRSTPDVQEAISVACVDYLYRISGDPAARKEALLACTSGASIEAARVWTAAHVRSAVFSAGLIARLARERELPGDIVDPIQVLSRDSLFRTMSLGDSSFAGGATSACIEIARRLIPKDRVQAADADAWSAWLECVGAIGLDEQRKDRVILQALDTLLRSEQEPHQSKPIFDAVITLSKGFTWTDGEESRSRLIWWFIDPDISSSDLHTVTLAATQAGLAAGLDASMVLGSGAGESERAAMRDRYREAWGESVSAGRNAVSQAFVDAAEAALRATSAPSVEDRLATALWYSQLIEVAESAWYGSAGRSAPTGKPSTTSAPAAPPWQTTLHYAADAPPTSGSWVVQYLSQRTRIPERKQLLAAYVPSSDSTLSIEAAVIVADALRGSPHDIRAAAAEVLRANASSPAFVNAFLNESAMMPLTRANAQLAAHVSQGRIVSLRNPTFRVVMRRSLVERLLELLSSDGDLSKVDGLSASLAESYQQRARAAASAAGKDPSRQPAADEPADEDSALQSGSTSPIERSARLLRLAVEDEAKRQLPSGREITTLQQIRLERIARAKAVQGRPQQFVAEQASAVDLLAYVVVAESPHRAQAVRDIVDAYATQRRSVSHVTEQIEAGERAMLKLWLLRVKGDAS
jgi:hypothetical protein